MYIHRLINLEFCSEAYKEYNFLTVRYKIKLDTFYKKIVEQYVQYSHECCVHVLYSWQRWLESELIKFEIKDEIKYKRKSSSVFLI